LNQIAFLGCSAFAQSLHIQDYLLKLLDFIAARNGNEHVASAEFFSRLNVENRKRGINDGCNVR
jgi:hypothetical protein